jgi:hypothetical protein
MGKHCLLGTELQLGRDASSGALLYNRITIVNNDVVYTVRKLKERTSNVLASKIQ